MSPNAYLEMAQTEAAHWWFRGRRDIVAAMIKRLSLPADAAILEVGAGTGGNLAMLSRFGKVSAVEMDATARQIAEQKTAGQFDIRGGRWPDDIPFSAPGFDLICFLDCLEHIAEDTASLVSARRILKPGGAVLITVPAYQWLWSQHDEFLHHQRRYSKRAMRATVSAAGLELERISHFNALLCPFAIAARLKDRLSGSPASTGSAVPAAPLNALLHRIFSAERHWLSMSPLPFGISLLAVARLP